jgi:hypothetical protein
MKLKLPAPPLPDSLKPQPRPPGEKRRSSEFTEYRGPSSTWPLRIRV